MEPYLLPAGGGAEVALAEDDPVERSGELEVHRHPALLAGDVEAGDLEQDRSKVRLMKSILVIIFDETGARSLIPICLPSNPGYRGSCFLAIALVPKTTPFN